MCCEIVAWVAATFEPGSARAEVPGRHAAPREKLACGWSNAGPMPQLWCVPLFLGLKDTLK